MRVPADICLASGDDRRLALANRRFAFAGASSDAQGGENDKGKSQKLAHFWFLQISVAKIQRGFK